VSVVILGRGAWFVVLLRHGLSPGRDSIAKFSEVSRTASSKHNPRKTFADPRAERRSPIEQAELMV